MDYYLTCAVLLAVLSALILTRLAPDLIFMAALAVLLMGGVLLPEEALKGFANSQEDRIRMRDSVIFDLFY